MTSDQTTKLVVLIVEDNPDHSVLTARLLGGTGEGELFEAEIRHAETLREARKQLSNAPTPVDAVLLDLNLPDSGHEHTLTEMLGFADDAAIIVLTSYGDRALGAASVQQGAQDFLIKADLTRPRLKQAILYAVNRKEKEAALARANAELKRFAHTVAHEIRTPASAAVMGIEAYRMFLDSDPATAEEMLATSETSLQQLLQLVSDMLTFAETDDASVPTQPVDLNVVCEEVIAGTSSLLGDGKIEFSDLPTVQGHPTQLRRLIQNLVGNAIKYRSTYPPRITITSTTTDEVDVVRVRDNGRGIEAEHQDKIFQMFYRAAHDESIIGTGVGLAMCRNIMTNLGGSITLQSTVGEGTCFSLTFPKSASAS